MADVDETRDAGTGAGRAADFEFMIDGAIIKVALNSLDPHRDPTLSLEKAKLAIARLALLQEREHRKAVREMPNVFDYWAYRKD